MVRQTRRYVYPKVNLVLAARTSGMVLDLHEDRRTVCSTLPVSNTVNPSHGKNTVKGIRLCVFHFHLPGSLFSQSILFTIVATDFRYGAWFYETKHYVLALKAFLTM